jgi:hypothetical protein
MHNRPLRSLARSVGSVGHSCGCVLFRAHDVEASCVAHATEEGTVFVQYLRVRNCKAVFVT